MTTDSESEADVSKAIRNKKNVVQFKWTPEYENQLEDILLKHYFDFH